MTRQDFV